MVYRRGRTEPATLHRVAADAESEADDRSTFNDLRLTLDLAHLREDQLRQPDGEVALRDLEALLPRAVDDDRAWPRDSLLISCPT